MNREGTTEWRKPNDDELKLIRKHSKDFADAYRGMSKTIGICVAIAVIMSAYCAYHLIRYGNKDMLQAVIVLAIIVICMLLYIFVRERKARFVIRNSNNGDVWVRDLVVVNKRCFTSRRNQYNETYYIDAHIDNFNGSYEDSKRSYSVSAYIYSIMHKGCRFIDV